MGRILAVIPGLHIDGQFVPAIDLRQPRQTWADVVGVYPVPGLDQVVFWGSSSKLVLRRKAPLLVI